ncbi:hypothetical protein N7532_003847 [Penicillium argentinense]|uniref:Uncharacterized protein n=1 Tax=Penicillium argentinense TaxID=1131581 RepID=A0A9W9KF27_9EURO|nr:uncharacterized protein N7532_003847 [Penicillium argentinense]KAJ5103318.1 hypothetical protein N7532_003847 [Penicillium argentinense]
MPQLPEQNNRPPPGVTVMFKKYKTTILLCLQPDEKLSAVKKELLEALKSRGVNHLGNDIVPGDPAELEFGLPKDRSDLEKGWTLLRTEPDTTVQDAGFTDPSFVAFRFRKPSTSEPNETVMDLDQDEANWDVIIPGFIDEASDDEAVEDDEAGANV